MMGSVIRPAPRLAPFLILVVALSAPFWLWGAFGPPLIPGLPVSGLMAFCPALAAIILIVRDGGVAAVAGWLGSAFDLSRLRGKRGWLALNFVLAPLLLALAWIAMRFAGAALPAAEIDWRLVPLFFAAFLAAGLGEELGWFGFAYPPMEARWGPLGAALALGGVWTFWHVVPYFQTGRGAEWIAWHCLATLALRVVAVWLFVNTGRSVLAAACFHAMCNVGYFQFPNGGSHYDSAYFAPIIASAALVIGLFWRPRAQTEPDQNHI